MNLKERLHRFRSFWIFPLVAIVLLVISSGAEPRSRRLDLLWLIPAGALIWTLLEYGLHRFIFHLQIPAQNPRLREFVEALHLDHHASPRDPGKVLVRPTYGLLVSTVLYGLVYGLSGSLFSASGIMAGIWGGFLYYEAVHYRVHFSLSAAGLIARQRRSHFHHHFTDSNRCFGVTSPVWDYVFGTSLRKPGRGPAARRLVC
jgi:sterol desaturase/sphingolipid hydroxylase (fatty acid hydroxylase superfamily)